MALGVAKYSEAETLRKAEKAQFEASLEQARVTVAQAEASVKAQQESLKQTRARLEKLQTTLREHDLTRLAKAKPCLIAKRMTAATRKAYARMAESTGAVVEEVATAKPKTCSV